MALAAPAQAGVALMVASAARVGRSATTMDTAGAALPPASVEASAIAAFALTARDQDPAPVVASAVDVEPAYLARMETIAPSTAAWALRISPVGAAATKTDDAAARASYAAGPDGG